MRISQVNAGARWSGIDVNVQDNRFSPDARYEPGARRAAGSSIPVLMRPIAVATAALPGASVLSTAMSFVGSA